ncbi:M15 family metallopeptidase [Marichromatium gracile]|uniref:Peptidoglycan L-alanyl-D-glutamate endopeptidase CwlK n=1 Tax=Marichromatium gracile TaxID=1048 RepID=A0A4R4A503_MARGR|nr:M15 family metallopeptidase [Marichromatium gracile]MBK1709815.1 peptidase M15 [Marichromatium gracile]TCW32675.1 peptidoglycan L-alanyl-D-glutamate endopeptidase CwlK [Marichromatium gracile]
MASGFRFSKRSERALAGVHDELVRVARRALELTEVDFVVTEGRRTEARQRALVAAGASRTLRSRHLSGHALDVAAWVDGGVRWDWPLYPRIAAAFKAAAAELGVAIRWGGDWTSFRDGPHFELDRAVYP